MLDRQTYATIVKNTPLISIDLIVRRDDGRVLLGLRRNNPARDTWFVPGGVIHKDERLAQAFAQISRNELGLPLQIADAKFLGVYEHLYETNFADDPSFGTHYIVLGYEIRAPQNLTPPPDQHHDYRWCSVEELLADPKVHENTKAYFR